MRRQPAILRFAVVLIFVATIDSFSLRPPPKSMAPLPPPPHVTHEEVAFFSEKGDSAGLSKALAHAFEQSARVKGPEQVELREILTARGAGFTYTSSYKLEHDITQLQYIANMTGGERANWLQKDVIPAYEALLARIPPLSELQRTGGLFPLALAPHQAAAVAPFYNRALNVPDFAPLEQHLNPNLEMAAIEEAYFHSNPSVAVIDNVLSPEALDRIRDVLQQSTVWYETKMPERFGGYLGAYLNDGLHARTLLGLAAELRGALPNILGPHPLRHLWAYKYDERYTGINVHADEAAVNLNFWVTPEDANLDKESGGLIIYTRKPPAHWTFDMYNQVQEGGAAFELLEESGWAAVRVPYKENRLVMFDSALFHKTDDFHFKPGFLNRRINLTLLFGEMSFDPPSSTPPGTCPVGT